MEDRNILIEALREEGIEPTDEQLACLDADLTKFAQILYDYFIEQKRHGRKISDPYPDDDTSNERNHLLSSFNKRAGRRDKLDDPT